MTTEISKFDDVIDSRDIIARIEELKASIQDINDDCFPDIEKEAELGILESLAGETEGYAEDWLYGVTLISEGYFTEYCEELCRDIGDIPSELPWYINNHINWDGIAREIKMDYTEVDFDGQTYFIR